MNEKKIKKVENTNYSMWIDRQSWNSFGASKRMSTSNIRPGRHTKIVWSILIKQRPMRLHTFSQFNRNEQRIWWRPQTNNSLSLFVSFALAGIFSILLWLRVSILICGKRQRECFWTIVISSWRVQKHNVSMPWRSNIGIYAVVSFECWATKSNVYTFIQQTSE